MYDLSLATNPDAYLPVKLALFKLGVKRYTSNLFKYFSFSRSRSITHPQNSPLSVNEPSVSREAKYKSNIFSSLFSGLWLEIVILGVLGALTILLFSWRQRIFDQERERILQNRQNQTHN